MKQAKIVDELISSGHFGNHPNLEPIVGGTVNQSYHLVAEDKQYFLKTFELNHIAPTDRQALFMQQQRLAEFGKASRPVYLSKAHDFQVESWIEHTSLLKGKLSTDQKVHWLAKVLFEIHQLPTFALSLDLPKDWLMYLDISVQADKAKWLQRIDECKPAWIDTHKTYQVLCHNDLAFEHVAISEPALVFDWEYASLGNRFFDVASCALINKLDEHATIQLQEHYAHLCDMPTKLVFEQCQIQFPIVSLTNELWYLAAKTVRKDKV